MCSTTDLLPNQLFQARIKANDFVQEHLKTIVTVASGTLVLTVSFIKDVIGTSGPEARLIWLLILSWVALALSICAGVMSLATLVNNLDDADFELDEDGVPFAFAAGKRGIVLRWDQLSIGMFGLGMASLAAFGAVNYESFLTHKEAKQESAIEKRLDDNPDRFSIVSSSTHPVASGDLSKHTFLLDQTTGEMWEMFCVRGTEVRFKKIVVEDIPRQP